MIMPTGMIDLSTRVQNNGLVQNKFRIFCLFFNIFLRMEQKLFWMILVHFMRTPL